MSIIKLVPLSSLFVFECSSPTAKVCENFMKNYNFNSEHLPGIWEIKNSSSKNADATNSDALTGAQVVWLYNLTPMEIVSYAEELRGDFPNVDWDKVKYSWNIVSYDRKLIFKSIQSTRLLFVLQIEDGPSGEITAIPAGDTYNAMKKSGVLMTTLKYHFKTLRNTLAVQYCEPGYKNEYILQNGLLNPDETDLQLVSLK